MDPLERDRIIANRQQEVFCIPRIRDTDPVSIVDERPIDFLVMELRKEIKRNCEEAEGVLSVAEDVGNRSADSSRTGGGLVEENVRCAGRRARRSRRGSVHRVQPI
ncbi:hypothetical protein R1flu_008425 [Riccia fluitans]|uniref:Uncharacterized protein n=1 Tax=Riccia fluitans TaxID=41844 RepID=A0ABD1YBW0_9MARC